VALPSAAGFAPGIDELGVEPVLSLFFILSASFDGEALFSEVEEPVCAGAAPEAAMMTAEAITAVSFRICLPPRVLGRPFSAVICSKNASLDVL